MLFIARLYDVQGCLGWPADSKEKAEVADYKVPIVTYLKDPGHGAKRNIRRLAFKYVLIDDELYR